MATVVETQLPPKSRVRLSNVRWETYEALLADLDGQHVRMTYDRGELEMMSPSRRHERIAELIGMLLVEYAVEHEIPFDACGTMTCRRQDLERGLEPDKCYYVANESALRGKEGIDLSVDPPPDLAIEVDLSSSSIDKLSVYAGLGVPEVWSHVGKTIQVFVLKDGEYAKVPGSLSFPELRLDRLCEFVDRHVDCDMMSIVREFRTWLREADDEA